MKNHLEKLRKPQGIKQEEFAAVPQVSRQTIGAPENGSREYDRSYGPAEREGKR